MPIDELFIRKAIVLAIALIYWAGVMLQARSVRRSIGRQPNVRPHGTREKLLWLGWMLVVITWITLPFLVSVESTNSLIHLNSSLLTTPGLYAGVTLILAGYAGTHWCYSSMGDTWRMGIDRGEKTRLVTRGPYNRVRHPIYLFQAVILIGVAALLPSLLAVLIIPVHLVCVWFKATDEEAYLVGVHKQSYIDYCLRTGRLIPKLLR